MRTAQTFAELSQRAGRDVAEAGRPVVCVQGLGFVGAAMAVAVARAGAEAGELRYDVIGVDLPHASGQRRIEALNRGEFPFASHDESLRRATRQGFEAGNLLACSDPGSYALASVAVVDLPLDVDWEADPPAVRWDGFHAGIRQLAEHLAPGALVVLETTVPPGTTQKVVAPIFEEVLGARGLPGDAVHLAHSYERVMPGRDYYDSIVNFWRVYSGLGEEAADACQVFLASIINTADFPLARVGSPTASEVGKLLENSFRATTIAFMEEWGRFAEVAGVDLFEVVEAIRRRPTHANMRTPGFGVGGYCLTKDPLFAPLASRELFGLDCEFPFSSLAVATNRDMPRVSVDRLERLLGGLGGRQLLLLGISYRQDVGDTRYSPSETFYREAIARGARVVAHDPLVSFWEELGIATPGVLPPAAEMDAVVFAVPHREYLELDFEPWLGEHRPLIFDGFDVLSRERREALRRLGCRVESIGRGEAL